MSGEVVYLMPCRKWQKTGIPTAALTLTGAHRTVPPASDTCKRWDITTRCYLLGAKPKSSRTQYIKIDKKQLESRSPTELSVVTGRFYIFVVQYDKHQSHVTTER